MKAADARSPRADAIRVLREALRAERQFVKAHAAEALLRNRLPESVRETFLAEAASAPPRYRVVAWRVLAQAAEDSAERGRFEQRVREAALDEAGPDRAHAVETWAKLALPQRPAGLIAASEHPELRPYALWALVASGGPEDEAALAALLRAEDGTSRLVAAYALMSMPRLRAPSLAALRAADPANAWVLAARHAQADDAEARRLLLALLQEGAVADRRLAATAFARRPDATALPALIAGLAHDDADVRIYSAETVLKTSIA